jgi:hypothetical protein
MMALVASHASGFAHICTMIGLYSTNSLLARKNIDNPHVFTLQRIFNAFTSKKVENLSKLESFFPRLRKIKINFSN